MPIKGWAPEPAQLIEIRFADPVRASGHVVASSRPVPAFDRTVSKRQIPLQGANRPHMP